MGDRDVPLRQSIDPTYDSAKTGKPYTVESLVRGRRISHERIADPFINTRVTVGWRDLLHGLLRRRLEVIVAVDANSQVVEDVSELDAEYLGCQRSTRRQDWNNHLNQRLGDYSAQLAEHEVPEPRSGVRGQVVEGDVIP